MVCEVSVEARLQRLRGLKAAGESGALVLADQQMPSTEGVEFLSRARQIQPTTRPLLLIDPIGRIAWEMVPRAMGSGGSTTLSTSRVRRPTNVSRRSPLASRGSGRDRMLAGKRGGSHRRRPEVSALVKETAYEPMDGEKVSVYEIRVKGHLGGALVGVV